MYNLQQINRTRAKNGGVVSTVYLGEYENIQPYETALIDIRGNTEEVERYDTVKEAQEGHERWVRSMGGKAFFQDGKGW